MSATALVARWTISPLPPGDRMDVTRLDVGKIRAADVVVVGGGGLISPFFKKELNVVLDNAKRAV